MASFGSLGGLSGQFGQTGNGYWNGVYLGNGLPTADANTSSSAPTYNLNDPFSQYALAITSNAGNAGWGAKGIGAFMPRSWSLPQYMVGNENDGGGINWGGVEGGPNAMQSLLGLASATGFDTSKYDLSDPTTLINADRQQSNPIGWSALYNDLQNSLQNYQAIGGMSSGWDNSGNPRSAATTLYYNDNNTLRPVTDPAKYVAPEKKGGWLQNEGSELLSALSVALPAFGGWAGILGQGTAGTLSAGSGLGLTTGLGSTIGSGLTNTLVNAGVNTALNGGGSQGFLGNLLQSGIGRGIGGLTGTSSGLGSMFDTSNAGVSQLNPLGYYQQVGRSLGFGGTPIGQVGSLLNMGRGLGNLFRS